MDFEQNDNKVDVERIVDEIKEANVTFENYKTYVDKITNTERIIMAQIGNLIRNYKSDSLALQKEKEADSYKRAEEEGFVPKRLLELSSKLNELIKEAYSWQLIDVQLYTTIFNKVFIVLDSAKALDIKRDALREMREMETKRNDLFMQSTIATNKLVEDLVNNKLSIMDNKFISALNLIQKQAMMEKQMLLNTFANIITKSDEEKKLILSKLVLKEQEKSQEEKIIEEPIQRVVVDGLKPMKSNTIVVDDDDDDASDPFLEEDDDNYHEPQTFDEPIPEVRPSVEELRRKMEVEKNDNS